MLKRPGLPRSKKKFLPNSIYTHSIIRKSGHKNKADTHLP